ncbi:hypothetical protein [Longimicrobium terrae]|uniref:Uncharacterized protein n=1 Tax=Longimicrobium terrae TaxID=1639882 RepID=A0A841H3M6_9BACT|nr:hypothetical protein [Longimicrobium terrae]MBB4638295.1 hypothetical protein [Longimicrobium terrae]MBB6072637.1 hypothetical protein [Longimicrobium terrae]NNC28584.1 hypothetical protein [Longimicrobium terrae]
MTRVLRWGILLLVAGCAWRDEPLTGEDGLAGDEPAVYAAAMHSRFELKDGAAVSIVDSTTAVGPDLRSVDDSVLASPEVWADFRGKQAGPPTGIHIPPSPKYRLVRAADLRGSPAFGKAFPAPGSYVRFSPVGFDRERRHALVFISFSCGPRCGTGDFVFLSRHGSQWRVDKLSVAYFV